MYDWFSLCLVLIVSDSRCVWLTNNEVLLDHVVCSLLGPLLFRGPFNAGEVQTDRCQNLNPTLKMNLNHTSFNLVILSQDFHTQSQLLGPSSRFTFQCRSCAHADFVAVVAAADWAGVADGCHIGGVCALC